MSKRLDLRTILVVGSGPIVIGQACEFDYSGCPGLQGPPGARATEVVLVNSNPATIMTDPGVADAHLCRAASPSEMVAREDASTAERPDALLPTMGGQTALNLRPGPGRGRGCWSGYGVEMIGAKRR